MIQIPRTELVTRHYLKKEAAKMLHKINEDDII